MSNPAIKFGAALLLLAATACGSSGSSAEPRAERTQRPSDSAEQVAAATASSAAPAAAATEGTQHPGVAAADRSRTAGDANAKVWMIIVSDFECPFCKRWHDRTYSAVRDEYVESGKVRLAYVHFPLRRHVNAMPTAQASMCAGEQGKFWEYHSALFDAQEQWAGNPGATALLPGIAARLKLNVPQFRECVSSGRMRPLIEADRARAEAAGVQVTPTFIVGKHIVAGAATIEKLRPIIDSAVAAAPLRN